MTTTTTSNSTFKQDDTSVIIRAAHFAAVAHRTQMRADGATPYINHPIGVAALLTDLGGITDPAVIAAALLHDTVEDCPEVTFDRLAEVFDAKICSIVREVTDDKSLAKAERKRLQVVNAPGKSREAKLVKLADKLYNLRDMQRQTPIGWTEERVQAYHEWAAQVVVGLKGTNGPLEKALEEVLAVKGVKIGAEKKD